jgi:hypothetical protein
VAAEIAFSGEKENVSGMNRNAKIAHGAKTSRYARIVACVR